MKGLIFTYLLTYGGTAASLVTPWTGLLIYVCFSIIRPESLWYWSVPQGNYSRIVAIGLLIGWGIAGFGNWRFGPAAGVAGCLVAYLAAMAVSATGAVASTAVAWNIVENFSKVVLPFVVALTLINSVKQLKQLAWVMLVSTAYIAWEMNLSYYGGYNRLQLRGFAPLDNNGAAVLMDAAAGLALFLGLGEKIWWRKLFAFGAAALMVNCVMFSFSRGGLLGLMVLATVSFALIPKSPRDYLMFALMVLLGYRLAGPQVVERFVSAFVDAEVRDASADSRLRLSENCLELFQQQPLLGIGPQQFPLVSHRFGWPPGKQAHTTWLQIAAEQGIVGLGLLLAFFGLLVKRVWNWRHRLAATDPWLTHIGRVVVASLVGYAVPAQFVSLQALEMPFYVALLGAGALKLASIDAHAAVA